MADYHVGCGAFGIYAGLLNSKGDMWKKKSDVTDECVMWKLTIKLEGTTRGRKHDGKLWKDISTT